MADTAPVYRNSLRAAEAAAAALCWLVISSTLFFSALGSFRGLGYELSRKGLWIVCAAAVLTAGICVQGKGSARGARWVLLMPVLAAAVIRMYAPAEGTGPFHLAASAVVLILGAILFFRGKAHAVLKTALGVLSLPLLVFAVTLAAFSAFWGTDGIHLEDYPDSSGIYTAQVRISDEGALGGSTTVTVYRPLLSLPFGELRRVEGTYRTSWTDADGFELRWSDGGTLTINGEEWDPRNAS